MELKDFSSLKGALEIPSAYKTIREISQLSAGTKFTAVVRIIANQQKLDKNNSPYNILEMGDATGSCGSAVFSRNPIFPEITNIAAGDIVSISGTAGYFNNNFRPDIYEIYKKDADFAERMGKPLVPVSPYNPDEMSAELKSMISENIKDRHLFALVEKILEENAAEFRESTAALKVHHSYKYGLLEHTLHVAKNAAAMAKNYPNVNLSLATAGAILHDIGKIKEYATGLEIDKTREGNLQTHMVLGYTLVHDAALKLGMPEKLRQEIEHIILSHHGKLEYGAVVLPQTPEAMIVHSADMADAFLGMIAACERNRNPRTGEFSDYIPAYGCNVLLDRFPEGGQSPLPLQSTLPL